MLVLTRHASQPIIIGDEIVITVLGIRGNQVSIGVAAPEDVPVHRQEIYERTNLELQLFLEMQDVA